MQIPTELGMNSPLLYLPLLIKMQTLEVSTAAKFV